MSWPSRRRVLQAGLVSLADLLVEGPLSREARAESRRGIFDAHLHTPSENGELFQWHQITKTMPDFVAYLDKCGVRRGVISAARSNTAREPDSYRAGNREVARYAERWRGRFRPSCVVTPFRIEEALREIEECATQLGFLWIGEFCNYMTGYRYDTPEWKSVMELAARLNLVVQIHTNTAEMRFLADTFPSNTIVFPHFGGNTKDIFERIAIVAAHPNTLIDVSGSGIERVGILERAVGEIGADRVLYGSDFTINEPSAVIARVRNAFLTAADREKILYGNLDRLLARAGRK
ncbi:MAG: amidohydrolase family protein [Bryobacterales bacterium]|nr:amidohydrolase family protein [Bryobacterales bacterium]